VPGELHLGGAGLARGYLNRPEMTADKFIPNPFSREPGARLYKTGDLARYRADGQIEFLARLDNQVKIRGFRVELEEIESILRRHPGVADAAILPRDDEPDGTRLVGYIVPRRTPAPGASDLRAFLRTKLPDHAVPVAFVALAALPQTPLGKLDRRALSRIAFDEVEPAAPGFTPPATPVERELAAIWSEVLRRKEIGRHDNFFSLGGHSLLATQVVLRVYDRLHVELPVATLFETATLSEFAAAVEAADKTRGSSPPPALRPRPRRLQEVDIS
jgi:hypothetical protein